MVVCRCRRRHCSTRRLLDLERCALLSLRNQYRAHLLPELFAKNSPTRLYEQATQKIEQHPEIRSILGDSLIFYSDPPTARKRRSHRVQHQLAPDARFPGRQVMTLSFWVESKPTQTDPWHVRARVWLREVVWEPSAEHLPPSLRPSFAPPPPQPPVSPVSAEAAAPSWFSWLFGSFFSSIAASWRGRLPERKKPSRPVKPALGAFTTGEATAILRQDSAGRFIFHSLTVDVPERGRGNYRVWLIKPQNVSGSGGGGRRR